jgi:two-component system response regulator YesN
MPKLDGLSMIDELRKQEEHTKFIIISGYGEFEYAQRAIGMKVFGYLLKPIDEKMITDILDRAEAEIQGEAEERRKHSHISKQLSSVLPVYYELLMNRWLETSLTAGEERELLGLFPEKGAGFVTLTCFSRQSVEAQSDEQWQWDVKMMMKRLLDFGHSVSFFLHNAPHRLVTVIVCDRAGRAEERRRSVRERLIQFTERVEEQYRLQARVGVGAVTEDIVRSIVRGYETAKVAAVPFFYASSQRIGTYEEAAGRYVGDIRLKPPLYEEFRGFLGEDADPSARQIGEWLQSVTGRLLVDPDALKEALCQMVQQIAKDNHWQSLSLQLDQIRESESIQKLSDNLFAMLKAVNDAIRAYRENRADRLINRCLDEIRANYRQDLTLDAMARQYHFNASYFSTLFKKATGVNFTDYLTRVRLEQAATLLVDTDKKVYEISQEVGYRDVKYFTKLYKKFYGLTPDEYRKFSSYA